MERALYGKEFRDLNHFLEEKIAIKSSLALKECRDLSMAKIIFFWANANAAVTPSGKEGKFLYTQTRTHTHTHTHTYTHTHTHIRIHTHTHTHIHTHTHRPVSQ